MKALSILGSTGSIGKSTLKLVEQFPDRFSLAALAAGQNVDELCAQAKAFRPSLVSVRDSALAEEVKARLPGVKVAHGMEGLMEVALHPDASMLVSALVGAVGLLPTHAALKMGRDVAVANKETLVMAGELMMGEAKRSGARLLPVDSEHSAVFQVVDGKREEEIKRIILTASGGPFRGKKAKELYDMPPELALKHPNWSMGPKITIDSATLMNKGLEVIEARWLFGLPPDKIGVTLHPQSIVHSMVEFVDGSVVAQLGVPDMRGPIGFALAYPERLPMGGKLNLDLWSTGPLTFEEPDLETFRCLGLAYEALKLGGSAPAVLSGANELAVEAYLAGRIKFGQIAELAQDALSGVGVTPVAELAQALEADRKAREFAAGWIAAKGLQSH